MSVHAAMAGVSVKLGSVLALDHVDLTIQPGQFMALLGPSGSGKTTTLNVLAGFVQPDRGGVRFDGHDVTGVPPSRRDLGIVFQGYALFPHMTVTANVEFPLRMRRVERGERRRKAIETLELVGLANEAHRSVATLSGGQRQRVALARALVFEPRLMLLDEPLAALDKQLRDSMQLELKRLQQRVGITTLAVTHDQVEALTIADVVAVMRDGRVEQVAPPHSLYQRPATRFVATFLGEANLVEVDRGHLRGFGSLGSALSGHAVIRPEQLAVNDATSRPERRLNAPAVIEEVTFQGHRSRVRARLRSTPEIVLTLSSSGSDGHDAKLGDEVHLTLDPQAVHVIPDLDEPTRAVGTAPASAGTA